MCNVEVNLTRKKRLVLVCVVALAISSIISLACSSTVFQGIHYELCNRRKEVNGSSDSLTPDFRVLGDPIDDPKPNSYKEIILT